MNLREQLFSNKAKIETVVVDGKTYYCRDYGADGRDFYEFWIIDRQEKAKAKAIAEGKTKEELKNIKLEMTGIRACMLICGLCDESGKQLLTPDDYDEVCKLPNAIVQPLFDKIAEMNKVTDSDIEELKKDLPEAQQDQ